MITRRTVLAVGLLLTLGAVASMLFSRFGEKADPTSILKPDNRQVVARGAELYADHCAACHGANLEGESNWRIRKNTGRLPAPPHDASGHTWHHPDTVLLQLTKLGPSAIVGGGYESDMPAYEGLLSDEEIIAVLSFIKSRWPEDVRRRHDELNRAQLEQR